MDRRGNRITLILLNSLCATILSTKQNLCFQCSDPNIEVHYGAFFNNPRILQDDSRENDEQPHCESGENARIQICRDPCYTLNVSTYDIRTGQLLLFGMSHGCSTLILPSNRIRSNSCYYSNILLQTTPAHPVQAHYCFCAGHACNAIINGSNVGGSKLKAQNDELVISKHVIATSSITANSTTKITHRSVIFLLIFLLIKHYSYLLTLVTFEINYSQISTHSQIQRKLKCQCEISTCYTAIRNIVRRRKG